MCESTSVSVAVKQCFETPCLQFFFFFYNGMYTILLILGNIYHMVMTTNRAARYRATEHGCDASRDSHGLEELVPYSCA